jgi:hypothetical protein
MDELKQIAESKEVDIKSGSVPRAVVREALSKHLLAKLVIEPIEPEDKNLYNAEYEHKKDVWSHKCIKDFMLS